MVLKPLSEVCFAAGPAGHEDFLHKALHLFEGSSAFVLLHSGGFPDPLGKYEWLMAIGAEKTFSSWETIPKESGNWLFGHLNYEACRPSQHNRKQIAGYPFWAEDAAEEQSADWPEVHFFHPQIVVYCRRGGGEINIEVWSRTMPPAAHLREDIERRRSSLPPKPLPHLKFKEAFPKEGYLETVEKLRSHIREGDCYEINFCNYREAITTEQVHPLAVWKTLSQKSPAPFGMLYQLGKHWAAGASPERYLRVEGRTVWSQPIKGTAPRGATPAADLENKEALRASLKEQAENVMIVDLTRSDFARVCEVGSVAVEELFGVYTFPKVHQLISTVRGTLAAGKTVFDAIATSFPMGSMTGAPRQKVMELIDQYEGKKRGLFSGTVGYTDPAGNGDFSVVIRTVFGNKETGKVHFSTGGAITWHSNAEAEWAEMLLKGAAIEGLFEPLKRGGI